VKTREEVSRLLADYVSLSSLRLEPEASVPQYYQLSRLLLHFLRLEHLRVGDPFPAEEALRAIFSLNRATINKAVQELVDHGWLLRETGRGVFVRQSPPTAITVVRDRLRVVDSGDSPMRVSAFEVSRAITRASVVTASTLNITKGSRVVTFRMLYAVNNGPLLVLDSQLPGTRFRGLEALSVGESLYMAVRERYGCSIHWQGWSVQAHELLEGALTDLLGASLLSPVLVLSGIGYDEAENPVEIYKCHISQGITLQSAS